jgi:hypothetical protein
MSVEHSPPGVQTRNQLLEADKIKKSNSTIPTPPNQTVVPVLKIDENKLVSPIKILNIQLQPIVQVLKSFHKFINKPNIAKMSTSLTEIAKFAKLVGYYDVDIKDVSIRSHFSRLETLAVIGQWTDEVKISVVICTTKGRAFDFISDTLWTQYITLKTALVHKYDSLDDVASLTDQLFNIRQKSASIREHATKFDILLNKLKSIGAVPLSQQTLLNVFLDGLLFKYKRDILLQGISNYDDALKRAVLLERLDTTETVGKVVAELACNQSSASSAVELENINFSTMESSINELKKSVAALSMRDSQ